MFSQKQTSPSGSIPDGLVDNQYACSAENHLKRRLPWSFVASSATASVFFFERAMIEYATGAAQ